MKKIFFAIISLSIFFACGDVENVVNEPTISNNWKVISLDDADATGFKATLKIAAPQKSSGGTSGCNQFGAAIVIDSTLKTIDFDPIITTKIGCINALGTFELNYYNALQVIDAYEFENQNLILKEKGKKRVKLGL